MILLPTIKYFQYLFLENKNILTVIIELKLNYQQ